jgi:RNA polymerase sigma factor (TIGR02999 family)
VSFSAHDEKPRQALDDLFKSAYRELSRLAAAIRRADANATISTATLVHETWLKLAHSDRFAPESPLHLKHVVAQAMRQYVVEAARRRCSSKRGGGATPAVVVTLDDSLNLPVSAAREVLALHAALEELARMNPRQATLVELRFFGGLETKEAADVLGIGESTALRDWRAAKAWLASEIRRANTVV